MAGALDQKKNDNNTAICIFVLCFVLFMSVICRMLLLPRGVFSVFVNYKNFGNNRTVVSSKYTIQNVGKLTDFFQLLTYLSPDFSFFFLDTVILHLLSFFF